MVKYYFNYVHVVKKIIIFNQPIFVVELKLSFKVNRIHINVFT